MVDPDPPGPRARRIQRGGSVRIVSDAVLDGIRQQQKRKVPDIDELELIETCTAEWLEGFVKDYYLDQATLARIHAWAR